MSKMNDPFNSMDGDIGRNTEETQKLQLRTKRSQKV